MTSAFADVESFLSERRIALVGASFDPKDFSRALLREMIDHGYDIVPVNRRAHGGDEIEGRRVFAQVGAIAGAMDPVGGALLMVPPSEAANAVRSCIEAGVRKVWLHRGVGAGAVTPEAVRLAAEAGLTLVAGECPLMFLPHTKLVHRAHGGIKKLEGRWPLTGLAEPKPGAGLVVLLVILQILLGASALSGGSFLVADPTGTTIGLPQEWLLKSPFSTYLVPGLVLGLIGLLHLAGALLTLRRRPAAGRVAAGLGVLMAAYIVCEWIWIPRFSFLQLIVLGLAAAEFCCAFLWFRHLTPPIPPPVTAPPIQGQGALRA